MARKRIEAGYLSPGISPPKGPDYIVVELKHDSRVAYSPTAFAGPTEVRKDTDALNKALSTFRVKRVASHFGMKAAQIRQRVAAAPASHDRPVSGDFAHAGFVQIIPRRKADLPALARQLNRLDSVWKAEIAPRPVPAAAPTGSSTVSRNFEPAQGYLHSPPNGIGAMEAWKQAPQSGTGKGITICDIEGNWNRNHEDLPKGIAHIGGTLINDLGWKNHGTAVLGEMVSRPGRSGTVGISHGAKAVVQSVVINGVQNAAAAITNAASKLKKGDVILIELHAPGPTGNYVAMQYWDAEFSAIRAAVDDKGITVVEAAGNGGEDFDLQIYKKTGLQKDSGAIVVGAGVPPTNFSDYFGPDWNFERYSKIGVPRSRIWFSNYGKIVNVQAWGWHVTTTGYGDAQGGSSQNRWYTLRFSGTSSASPIVTGSVACIQGLAKAKHGKPLTPKKVRNLLITTGTPQRPGPGVPVSQHIGPQPDLSKAFKHV
jgi:subtilisin family serine protease